MSRWTIDEPKTLDFDGVVALKVTLVAGSISVLASAERPAVQVTNVDGAPIRVSHDAGMLDIAHDDLWDGVLRWLQRLRCNAEIAVTVPGDCPVQITLVSADAVITGMAARTSIKSAGGGVTLDGVTGEVDANTVSGAIEAQGLDGAVRFTSVSGDLALAGGSVERLAARSVTGRIAADVDLAESSTLQVHTISGEVVLRLPESASAEVNLTSTAGRIDTSFDGLERHDRPGGKIVTGTLGDGSGRLSVNTVSGGVTLLSRAGDDASIRTEDE